MGIREAMDKNRGITMIVTTVFTLAALALGAWHVWSSMSTSTGAGEKAFFTVDDGKTFFLDTADKIPPFDHKGKPAYGCHVFSNDGGKTKYVGWMFRFTEEGLKRFEQMRASKGSIMGPSPLECLEVKKPGTGEDGWIKYDLPKAKEIQQMPKTPAGANAEPILPE